MTEPDPPPTQASGFRRGVYVLLGYFFVFLAILGAALPVLPTTPFVLLASYFFVRSSPRLHAWLLRSRLFGPMLRDWQTHRGVRPHVKVVALVMIAVMITASAVLGDLPLPLILLLCVLGLIGIVVVLRLPVVRDTPSSSPQASEAQQSTGVCEGEPRGSAVPGGAWERGE